MSYGLLFLVDHNCLVYAYAMSYGLPLSVYHPYLVLRTCNILRTGFIGRSPLFSCMYM